MNRCLLLAFLLLPVQLFAQELTGFVVDRETNKVLEGVTVSLKSKETAVRTDGEGRFHLKGINASDTLRVYMLGYQRQNIVLNDRTLQQLLKIALSREEKLLEEVEISTGYYQLPKERATGSFTHVDNELVNRSISTDILSRLENVSNGLAFDRSTRWGENQSQANLRVRGISTLLSDSSPLIVVDNFPYEGDIANINPNDVEDITVLKDAAAASIWGARAGNGVIVINTKRGKLSQPFKLAFNNNTTLVSKPDLYYNPKFISSTDHIAVQKAQFETGAFFENDRTVLSPAVEWMIQERKGEISTAELESKLNRARGIDVRDDAMKYLYRPAVNQQYAFNLSGGSDRLRYFSSVGYDKENQLKVGDDFYRITLNNNLSYQLQENLSLSTGVYYTQHRSNQNGLGISELNPSSINLYPYAELADEHGRALAIARDYRLAYVEGAEELGLLDWHYRPLDEIGLADNMTSERELRLNVDVNYRLPKGFSIGLKYQYQGAFGSTRNYYGEETYFTRNAINMFTQPDGTKRVPPGGVLAGNSNNRLAHYGRAQLNYDKIVNVNHKLNMLAGYEVRQQQVNSGPGSLLYGFDNEILTSTNLIDYSTLYPIRPGGSARIPAPSSIIQQLTDRFVSYFGNAAYSFIDRYTFSASARWDASNLFGVRTNQRGVPLWSVGAGWNVISEPFMQGVKLDKLKLRATYGHNGNINKLVSAYPRVTYATAQMTGLPTARLTAIGNPALRWEKVETTNIGLDFALASNRIVGTVEYYNKDATDLIGYDYLDPTTGIAEERGNFAIDNRINYASMNTHGVDIELHTKNIVGKFSWATNLLFSYTRNKVKDYMAANAPTISSFFPAQLNAPPRIGQSFDVLYALPWYGLDGQTGQPQVLANGEMGTDYNKFLASLTPEDLTVMGVTVPPYFGAVRNEFSYKAFTLSVNVAYKLGYVFRSSSIHYSQLLSGGIGHRDFAQRWQQPGDEFHTHIPALPLTANFNRDMIYTNAEVLVESGNHIRLQDVNISYDFGRRGTGNFPLKNMRLYMYANNLAILWRANKRRLDPDYPLATYPAQRSFALGLRFDL